MLKPYVCVACEKIIIEHRQETPTGSARDEGGPASLISLFSKIMVGVPANAPQIPPNAVAPKEWAVYSEWDTEPGDESRNYVLCTQIFYPDQSPFADVTRNKIPVQPKTRSRMIVRILGFPIGQMGFYTVRTWVEEDQNTVVGPIEFKIELETINQPQVNQPQIH
jgi:hypothetical protein